MSEPEITLTLRRKQIVWTLALIIGALVLLHIGGLVLRFGVGTGEHYGLINIRHEGNIPTYFAALLLLAAALLLAGIAAGKRKAADSFAWHWTILAIGFLYLSMDEAAAIHERLQKPTTVVLEALDVTALFGPSMELVIRRAWIVAALALSSMAALFYVKFLVHLPRRSRLQFLLAGSLYVASAVGLELIGAYYRKHELAYDVCVVFEETGEMASIVFFIHAVLRYIETTFGCLRVSIGIPATVSARYKVKA